LCALGKHREGKCTDKRAITESVAIIGNRLPIADEQEDVQARFARGLPMNWDKCAGLSCRSAAAGSEVAFVY
jgi:hypothetical protein